MSKPQVTITFGRSRQVVRRGEAGFDDSRSDTQTLSGSKRSIKDRLGSNVASSSLSSSNSRGRDDSGWSSEGARVGQNDLRLKLIAKKISKRTQGSSVYQKKDLREKITRTMRSPMRDTHYVSEPKESRIPRQVSSIRSADNLAEVESSRRSASVVTMDPYKHRSPVRAMQSYRGDSPTRSVDELRRIPPRNVIDVSRNPPSRNMEEFRPVVRTVDASRNGLLTGNASFEPRRSMAPSPITMQGGAPGMSRPVSLMPPPRPPTTNVIMHKSSPMGYNVAELLDSLGLGKYYINFQAEEVDMTALRQMGDIDLKEMGIPMGPRKKILLALKAPTKRPMP